MTEKKEKRNELIEYIRNKSVKIPEANSMLESIGSSPVKHGCKMIDLLLRPEININLLINHFGELKEKIDLIDNRKEEIIEATEIQLKYEGYIAREQLIANKLKRLENIKIKGKINYDEVHSLSTEARQKLKKIDPETIGQASRISGISPSDINILLIMIGR
mgnify:FL=1